MPTSEQPSILEAIATRPSMYWGESANHFHSFRAFLAGVELSRATVVTSECKESLDHIIPPHFNEFVRDELGVSFPNVGMEWAAIIESQTTTDREALSLLISLRKKYDDSRWAATTSDS